MIAAVLFILQCLCVVESAYVVPPRFNRTLTVTTIKIDPYFQLKTTGNGDILEKSMFSDIKNKKYEGYIMDLLEELAKRANFEYNIKPVKDGLAGTQDRYGSWNGMIGQLVDKEADIAAGPLTYTEERAEVVDLTRPHMLAPYAALFRRDLNFKTIEDVMFDESDTPVGVLAHGSAKGELKLSEDYSLLYDKINDHPHWYTDSIEDGIERVIAGKYVFIEEYAILEHFKNVHNCLVDITDATYFYESRRRHVLAVAKGNNELLNAINDALFQMYREGQLYRLKRKWWPNTEC